MASDALNAFLHADFHQAENVLHSLASDSNATVRNDGDGRVDFRVTHNSLVTSFYAHGAQQNLDNFTFAFFTLLPANLRPVSVHQFFQDTATDRDALRLIYSAVGPVPLYNIAVIAYYLGYVPSAAHIGELLYAKVEAMDDWLAIKACFLLIDIHLRRGDALSANTPANYLSKLLQSSEGNGVHSTVSRSQLKQLAPDWAGRFYTLLPEPMSHREALFCLQLYNTRLAVTTDNTAEAVRETLRNMKLTSASSKEKEPHFTVAGLLLEARNERNHLLSLHVLSNLLTKCPEANLPRLRPVLLNSLGILHHGLGRHALAACYFEHSRKSFDLLFQKSSSSQENEAVHLTSLRSAKDTQVSYNLALQYMKLGDYTRALDLFSACAQEDRTNSERLALMWLRMAECCVGIEATKSGKQSLSVQGRGRGRRLVMQTAKREDSSLLEYAATCAKAALAILKKLEEKKLETQAYGTERFPDAPGALSGRDKKDQGISGSLRASEQAFRVRTAALMIVAYCSLTYDPQSVLKASDELLGMYPGADNEHCQLARLYAAEALCRLERFDEATKRLSPIVGPNTSADTSTREAASINMALTEAGKKDFASASRAARVALKNYSSPAQRSRLQQREAIFATSYIFLRNGEVETARHCLNSLINSSD